MNEKSSLLDIIDKTTKMQSHCLAQALETHSFVYI